MQRSRSGMNSQYSSRLGTQDTETVPSSYRCFWMRIPLTISPIYDDLIEPSLPESPAPRQTILYCPTFEPFEASDRLSKFIDDRRSRGVRVVVSDPKESSFEPITWFAPVLARSAGVVVHFAGRSRNRSTIYNRRHAFVAGMAVGMESPLLMIAEEDYFKPFDYEAKLLTYKYARECVQHARGWFESLTFEAIDWHHGRRPHANPLVKLRLGEHVAENELDQLPDYFVETAAYNDVLSARDTIFIGHRGTGKTANALQALDELSRNKTILTVLIKPPAFEFPAMFAAVASLAPGQHEYFFDSLWRFVIQSEIAAAVLQTIEGKSRNVPLTPAEQGFLKYVNGAPFDIRGDISTRLEQTLNYLATKVAADEASNGRNLINESFHSQALNQLRKALGPVLQSRHRVAVAVDNLDKGWKRQSDFTLMARFILGLLIARGNVIRDFSKHDFWRARIKLTIAIFLRSDIYNYLRLEAREPDKLPLSTVKWTDPETLLSVIESRYLANVPTAQSAEDLWSSIFCQRLNGKDLREYLTEVTLPRPRDLVYLCNSAIGSAIDHHREVVEESDFMSATDAYSQYAYEALLVENRVTVPEMQNSLLAFLGADEIMAVGQVKEVLRTSGLDDERLGPMIDKLKSMSFLGSEVKAGVFEFPEVGSGADRAAVRAAKLCKDPLSRRLRVHPAFHSFLDIVQKIG
jgi:hypothetical protein